MYPRNNVVLKIFSDVTNSSDTKFTNKFTIIYIYKIKMVDNFELSWGSLEQTVQAGILPWDITVQVNTIDVEP